MDKQILTQEIYKIIKQYIKESENPLIEDYIPASNLPEMQRDLVNRLEKLVVPKIAEIEEKYKKMFCDTILDEEHRELYIFREQETNTILAENVWAWFAEILQDKSNFLA